VFRQRPHHAPPWSRGGRRLRPSIVSRSTLKAAIGLPSTAATPTLACAVLNGAIASSEPTASLVGAHYGA
jgi:hypothetical protein